jgi:hypothetical protein
MRLTNDVARYCKSAAAEQMFVSLLSHVQPNLREFPNLSLTHLLRVVPSALIESPCRKYVSASSDR